MSATSTTLSDAFLELSGGFNLALETLSTQLDVVVTAQADEDREVAVTVSSELVVRLAPLFSPFSHSPPSFSGGSLASWSSYGTVASPVGTSRRIFFLPSGSRAFVDSLVPLLSSIGSGLIFARSIHTSRNSLVFATRIWLLKRTRRPLLPLLYKRR
jgi:hypothetical protein